MDPHDAHNVYCNENRGVREREFRGHCCECGLANWGFGVEGGYALLSSTCSTDKGLEVSDDVCRIGLEGTPCVKI